MDRPEDEPVYLFHFVVYTEHNHFLNGFVGQGCVFYRSQAGLADNNAMATDLTTILRLTVPLIVQVGTHRMPMDDVLALGPGAILELEKSSEEELELLVNNMPMGRGVAVKVGENFGIRITTIGSPRQRVKAMAGDDVNE